MFYRRKVILALLEMFDGQLDKIRLQKLLFLFCKKQPKPEYDFIPYKYGCYSYSANADMTAMVKKGQLIEDEHSFGKNDPGNYLQALKAADRKLLDAVTKQYGQLDTSSLIKYTYINYPFYAINSEIAEALLSSEEYERVQHAKSIIEGTTLFTIGYEGISLEEYLVRLIKNDVKLLVDVRNNPISMKYGFSKSHLTRYCTGLGIQYIHIPEVGIHGNQRQQLNSQSDYDNLFKQYRETNLISTVEYQKRILNSLKQYKRVALTCFEANICQCHRKHLAEAIGRLPGFEYDVKHI